MCATPLDSSRGTIVTPAGVFPCALGRSGVTTFKREGDGATPLRAMRVLGGYFRADKPLAGPARRCCVAMKPIHAGLGWCDAPADRNYNRPVALPYPASHERMLRDDRLYDVCLVLDFNIRPRRRGGGSAIFLHVARPGFLPTEGCIAVSPHVMRRLLPFITCETVVRVVR